MTDQNAELDVALDRVIEAARAHLAAVKAAAGRIDDDDVWQAYVDLNNASFAYDEKLLDAFGEVTPWDVESIDPDEADRRFGQISEAGGAAGADPYPQVVSVRQRRDYRVPSVSALLRVAETARRSSVPEDEDAGPVESVGEAVLELLQAGDGSLASLDVPELEPLDGLLTVTEVAEPLDLEAFDDADGSGPFAPVDTDVLVGRLDEHPFLPDEDEHDHHDHAGHKH
ncbi:hypothetical protein Aph02nite_03980 [Actinoplanes philippinensis]|uniref:Uncharacterized protein n=1 Tax=Actinoplanes philippinensis TaxID=35752 RepID=A0A1I2D656_9ACTN|nr:hypothetical protein [Actinoplanes philippinensis]GIE74448.1 hypothetical protein Aph02nite_03980 [Actinoplanes philippinensis]SFE75971.1 hypothetical protein SAMN05421541_103434 [Actinoplanes philippinensis]